MTLVSLPMTRLRVVEAALGWLKLTVSCLPIENPCQLMTALLEDWLMLVVLPDCWMPAVPATTEPPVGPASPGRGASISAPIAVMVANEFGKARSRRRGAGSMRNGGTRHASATRATRALENTTDM